MLLPQDPEHCSVKITRCTRTTSYRASRALYLGAMTSTSFKVGVLYLGEMNSTPSKARFCTIDSWGVCFGPRGLGKVESTGFRAFQDSMQRSDTVAS